MASDDDVTRAQRMLYELRNGRGIAPDADVRAADICRRYASGETLEEIAQTYDLTRERVRQLLSKSSLYSTSQIRQALKIEAAAREAEAERATRARVAHWSADHPGASVESGVDQLGLTAREIRRHLGPRARFHPGGVSRRVIKPKYSDDELISMLRQFHEETGDVGSMEFENWSRARGGPTRQVVILRFATWAEAAAHAGFEARRRGGNAKVFEASDCWAAVLDFIRSSRTTSFADCEKWLRARPDMPSAALVRNQTKMRWADMCDIAARILSGNLGDIDADWAAEVSRPRDWGTLRNRGRDFDPVDLLQRAFDSVGFPLTSERFNAWAETEGAPSAMKLCQHAGRSWNELLGQAGIELSARQRARGKIVAGTGE